MPHKDHISKARAKAVVMGVNVIETLAIVSVTKGDITDYLCEALRDAREVVESIEIAIQIEEEEAA
jgi:hypothetical protein